MKKYLVICFFWDYHKHYIWHEIVDVGSEDDFIKEIVIKAGLQTDYADYKGSIENMYEGADYEFVVEEILP